MKYFWHACLTLLLAAPALAQNQFVYTDNNVNIGIDKKAVNSVSAFKVNEDGSLTQVKGSPYATGGLGGGNNIDPEEIAVSTQSGTSFLYAANDGSGTISAYAINPVGGSLARVAGSPFPTSASPLDLDVNCAGNLVFVVDDGSYNGSYSTIDVFSLARDGSLAPVPGEPFYNGSSSTNGGLALSPNGQYLFVTDTFSSEISSLAVSSDGALSQVPGSPYATSDWPGGVAVTANGKFVYATLFAVAEIEGRSIATNGALAPVPGTPFSTGQAQEGVPTLITFPARSCAAQ